MYKDTPNNPCSSKPYYPFGMIMPGRSYTATSSYRFGFNGQLRDDEVSGIGNINTAQFWEYDTRLGKRWNIEPLIKKFSDFSSYLVFGNNPIFFKDADGKIIFVPNINDREPILKMINAKALGTFAFDKNGLLYQVNAKGDASNHSKYYSDRLVQAIASPKIIEIRIQNPVKVYQVKKDADGSKCLRPTAKEVNLDDDKFSGGVTQQAPNSINILTFLSGNSTYNAKDAKGDRLKSDPSDILLHELLGHAIPAAVGKDTGNAVENENKARKELHEPLRAPEPGHTEQ